MHPGAYAFVTMAVREHGATAPVYEIGSRNINGTVRGLFERGPGMYLGVDLCSGPDVDLVTDASVYRPPMPVSTVVCCEVLEHTPQAEAIVARACEALAPGGVLIITCAGPGRPPHSASDGGPLRTGEYYRNIDHRELVAWVLAGGVRPRPCSVPEPPGDTYLVGVRT